MYLGGLTMADFFKEVLKSVDTLTPEQMEQLASALAVRMQGKPESKKDVQELEFNGCPHCGSIDYKKHGLKAGKQRYFCKDCRKTFVSTTGTILYRSKLSEEQWKGLILGIIQNLSLKEISETIDCTEKTVWLNKAKLSLYLKLCVKQDDKFIDIAECDEYYATLSFKGKRDPSFFIETLDRMPRHHRTREEKIDYLRKAGYLSQLQNDPVRLNHLLTSSDTYKRGISNDQTCILTCKDRSGDAIMDTACIGRLETRDVTRLLSGKFEDDAILVTDSHPSYPKFAREDRVHLEQIPTGKHTKGPYNLSRVNALHSNIASRWADQNKKQPATKYMDLSLMVMWWLQKNSELKAPNKVDKLYNFLKETSNSIHITYKDIIERPLTLNTKKLIPQVV